MPERLGQDDCELRALAVEEPIERSLSKSNDYSETYLDTTTGRILVAHTTQEITNSRPVIITYHDLGLNYVSNFQAFFNFPEFKELSAGFPIFHINAPGQEDGAPTLPADYEYPSMEQLAEQVQEVINHFKIVKYIGIGVGLGANVLTRHSLAYPERVECLMLVNNVITKAGWVEWGYQKRNVSHMRTTGITQQVQEYLLWHHLGDDYEERAHDLLQVYKDYFAHNVNSANLAGLVEQHIWRSEIPLSRDNYSTLGSLVKGNMLQAPVLNLVGIHAASAVIEGTVTFNGSLNPTKTSWIKIQDAAMVLEETPDKVTQALRLFLQGQGFCLNIRKNALPL